MAAVCARDVVFKDEKGKKSGVVTVWELLEDGNPAPSGFRYYSLDKG
jgi:hypothetical protein